MDTYWTSDDHEAEATIQPCVRERGRWAGMVEGWSPTYAAHDAHDPPAGVIAHTCDLHGRPPSALWPLGVLVVIRSGACSSEIDCSRCVMGKAKKGSRGCGQEQQERSEDARCDD